MTGGVDDLILAYLDGTLPPEEMARLDEALRSDPAVGDRFVRLALLEELLPELAAEEPQEHELQIVETPPSAPTRRRLASGFTRRTTRRLSSPLTPLPWGKIAAGVLLGLAVLFFLTRQPESRNEPSPVEARNFKKEPPVPVTPPPAPPVVVPPIEVPVPVVPPTRESVPPVTPSPTPEPPSAPPAPPPKDASKPRPTETVSTAWATVTRAEGSVLRITATGRSPVKIGAELLPGDGLESGSSAAVAFRYPDGTLIEAQNETSIADAPQGGRPGRTLLVSRGSIAAQVAPQPVGSPFVIQTPQSDVTVVGTRFALTVTPAATRLEVREGRVRLARKSDNKTVEVSSGQFAVAGTGMDLRPQPLAKKPPEETPVAPPALYRFDFEDGRRSDLWEGGLIEAGPKRDGNKFCLNADKLSVTVGGRKPLTLRYSDDLVLSFDHWVATANPRLSIRFVNASQNMAHVFTVLQVPAETWSRFSMPIKDMIGGRFRDGDRIVSVTILIESRPKAALYVDNFEVTEKKK